jgi:hypothetical protein
MPHMVLDHNGSFSLIPSSQIPSFLQQSIERKDQLPVICRFWSSLTSLAQLSVLEITTTFCTEFSFSCSFTDFLLWSMKCTGVEVFNDVECLASVLFARSDIELWRVSVFGLEESRSRIKERFHQTIYSFKFFQKYNLLKKRCQNSHLQFHHTLTFNWRFDPMWLVPVHYHCYINQFLCWLVLLFGYQPK